MAKIGISARGEEVNFDILKIKQQLAAKPVSIGVDDRRKFIDTKNGIKPKEVSLIVPELKNGLTTIPVEEINEDTSGMLDFAIESAQISLSTEE